jgi:uncharacterized membrane protein (UPF0127 family)
MDRMRGLLGRPALNEGEGLIIEPCGSVHTLGMRYSLDLIFLDQGWKIREFVYGLRPLRLAANLGAVRTLEMAAGVLPPLALSKGDVVTWRETV